MQLIKTGDMLFRHSEAYGPFGIPFSLLVAKLSQSKYSHASIAFWEGEELFILEVDDLGTHKMTFQDWEDICVGQYYAVYRPKESIDLNMVLHYIYSFLEKAPEYDFTFNNPDKFYCVESVVYIYCQVGLCDLFTPMRIAEILPWYLYMLFWPINRLVGLLTGKSVNTKDPLYFVGNEKWGMMSSPHIDLIAEVLI